MKIILTILISVFIFTGCSLKKVNIKTNGESTNTLKGKTFTFVKREKPISPIVQTPSKAILAGLTGGIGAAAIYYDRTSNNEEEKYKHVPAYYINSNLKDLLVNKYGMKYVHLENLVNSNDIDDFIESYKDVDYILDSNDLLWSVLYYPLHWKTYYVWYANNLKFIDTKKRKVIGSGTCEYKPEYSESMPSYDEMFANDGKVLKMQTNEALEKCLKELNKQVF